ncbi:MAG: LytTR family DNA-binding domain-containing protein [Acholeplasma sp.]|nr:LytTR family DNA-binding domain-containing protein [Acholeplasma sp.]
MISIALCDDEVKYLDYYENRITVVAKKLNLPFEIIRFKSGESLLFYLEDNPNKFHLIYLDIITDGINGIETAKKIRNFNSLTKIIFLTSTKSFVFNAFEVNATDYLIKDEHDEKFDILFKKTVSNLQLNFYGEFITFKSNNTDYLFELNQIKYFENYKRLIIIHLHNQESHEFYYKIGDLKNRLEANDFVLVHRSYLVNMQYIKKISKTELTLKDNSLIPVSRTYYNDLKEKFINYLKTDI